MQSLRSSGVLSYRPGIGIGTVTGIGYRSSVIGGGRRSCRPFVASLTHSRKLYSSKDPGAQPPTPLEQSLSRRPHVSNNSLSFTPTSIAICPTTINAPHTNPRTLLSSTSTSTSISGNRLYSRLLAPALSSSSSFPASPASPDSPLPIMYEGKWTALTVRKTFLDYFAERGHTIGTMRHRHPFISRSIRR